MDQTLDIPPVIEEAPPRARVVPSTKWLGRIAVILIAGVIVVYSAIWGLEMRRWVWGMTGPERFTTDIDRGFGWGHSAVVDGLDADEHWHLYGYLNQYEKMQEEQPRDGNWLDYAPLRLAVMTGWGLWAHKYHPDITQWNQCTMGENGDFSRTKSYQFTAPVLWFNTFMETLGAVCAFFLTRLWVIRGDKFPPQRGREPALGESRMGTPSPRIGVEQTPTTPFRGCFAGLCAALLLWFNPAMMISAYGWPTWDMWIVPMFLLAALMASLDWWFCAGIALGIGSMFKGQQLTMIPVFAIWALIIGRPTGALRMLCGVAIAIGLIVSPWLVSYIPPDKLSAAREVQSAGSLWDVPPGTFNIARTVDWPALSWIGGMLLAAIALPFLAVMPDFDVIKRFASPARDEQQSSGVYQLVRSPWTWRAVAVIAAMIFVIWPWLLPRNKQTFWEGTLAAVALAIAVLFVARKSIGFVAAGAVGGALLLSMSVFHGSTAWYDCGIHYGTIHWPVMRMGLTDNVPAIMTQYYGWPQNDITITAMTLPARLILGWPKISTEVSIQQLLRGIFIVFLLISAIGVGLQARRNDRRMLVALVTPWLMFFCIPAQIHERYLLFAAGVSCICIGTSLGMALLGVFLSGVTFIMTLHCMMDNSRGNGDTENWGVTLAHQWPALFQADSAVQKVFNALSGTFPDLGWAVALCGLIFLYYSFVIPVRHGKSRNTPRP